MKKITIISVVVLLLIIIGMLAMRGNEQDTEVTRETTKVGVLFNGALDDRGWTQSHFEGLSETAEELNLEIMYREEVPFDDNCITLMQELIDEGCKIIICNSFDYGTYMKQVAEKNPEITFLHATGVETGKNIATYFGRIYQMRYLCGVVAGLQTETDSIGYVAAFPIDEVNRGINAFTLGVQSVNPDAVVHVYWSESWTDDNANTIAANTLIDEYDVDVLTMHCDTTAPLDVAEGRGVWSIGYNKDNSSTYPKSYLTAAVWNWEEFYTPQLLECLQGKFQCKQYWEGAETGLVDLAPLTSNVKEGTEKIVKEKAEQIYSGAFDVFYGPVTDTEGNIRVDAGENMPDAMLLNAFDWYVKGVDIHEE
nr:BMP family ABC transporter substrate-binding protein [Lachnospiraceae bacterium]